MKSAMLKKTSQLLALFLILSALTPVLSFAAIGISDYKYDKVTGQVTATVYSDTYDPSYGGVTLNIYGDNNKFMSSVALATYSRFNSATKVTYYDFSTTVTSGVYNAVYLQGSYHGTVTDKVYATDSHDYTSPGGGWYGWPGDSNADSITVPSSGDVSADDLVKAFANKAAVVLKLNGDYALVPAAGLLDAVKKDGAVLKVANDNGAYILPLSVFKLDDLAKALGIDVKDLKIKVSIAKVTGDAASAVTSSINSLGGTQLADPVDFSVAAVGTDGKSVDVDFGGTYVVRQLSLSGDVEAAKTTGLYYDETGKKVGFVPATFEKQGDKTVASLKRNSSSIYTAAKFDKNFADIAGHWAQSYVQLLANKLVVDGVTNTTFEPERNITRAEFAALVVRSLSLAPSVTSQTYFSDVSSSDWYAGVVASAVKAGIIDGYEDGTFRPNNQITREELAAMVVRAMKYAGVNTSLTDAEQANLLGRFSDSDKIVWGQKEIAVAIKNGIINGMTDDTIGSYLQATRAQSATMLERFLTSAGFIN